MEINYIEQRITANSDIRAATFIVTWYNTVNRFDSFFCRERSSGSHREVPWRDHFRTIGEIEILYLRAVLLDLPNAPPCPFDCIAIQKFATLSAELLERTPPYTKTTFSQFIQHLRITLAVFAANEAQVSIIDVPDSPPPKPPPAPRSISPSPTSPHHAPPPIPRKRTRSLRWREVDADRELAQPLLIRRLFKPDHQENLNDRCIQAETKDPVARPHPPNPNTSGKRSFHARVHSAPPTHHRTHRQRRKKLHRRLFRSRDSTQRAC